MHDKLIERIEYSIVVKERSSSFRCKVDRCEHASFTYCSRRRGDLVRAGQWLAEHLGTPVVLLSEALFRTLGGGGATSHGAAALDEAAAQDATAARAASSAPGGSSEGGARGGNSSTSNSAAAGAGCSTGPPERGSSHSTVNGMDASAAAGIAAPALSLADDGDDLLDELLAGERKPGGGTHPPLSSSAGGRPAAQQLPGSNSNGGNAAPLPAARSTAISQVQQSAALPRPAVNGSSTLGDDLLDDLLDGSEDDTQPLPGKSHIQAVHPAAPLPPSSSVAGAVHAGKQMQQRALPAVKTVQNDQSSDGDDLLDELFGSGLSLGPAGKPSAIAAKTAVLSQATSAQQRSLGASSRSRGPAQAAAVFTPQPGQAASSRHTAAAAPLQLPPQPAAPSAADTDDLLSELVADDEQHRELQGGRGACNSRRSRQPAAGSDDGIQIAEVTCHSYMMLLLVALMYVYARGSVQQSAMQQLACSIAQLQCRSGMARG